MSLIGKARWTLQHRAFKARPATSLLRLAVWRARTALRLGATVPVGDARMRLWCPPEWRGNAKLTYLWRNEYEAEAAQLSRWLRSGDLAVDIGAHYGAYTLPMARIVAGDGQVVALEPARHARQVLSRNLHINNVDNVRVLPVAAGRDTTRGTLHMHDDRSRASLHTLAEGESGAETGEVVAAGLPARGAWDVLASHGYRMYRVTDAGRVILVQDSDHRCAATNNIVAIHPDTEEYRKRSTAHSVGQPSHYAAPHLIAGGVS